MLALRWSTAAKALVAAAAVAAAPVRAHEGSVAVPFGPSYRSAFAQVEARSGRSYDPVVIRSRAGTLLIVRELWDGPGTEHRATVLVRSEKDKPAALALARRHVPGWKELPWKEAERVQTVSAYLARLRELSKEGHWRLDVEAVGRAARADLAGVTAAVYEYDLPDAQTRAWMKLRMKAQGHVAAGRHQLALDAARKALDSLAGSSEADLRREISYTDIAAAHHMMGDFKASQRHYEKALGVYRKLFPMPNERYADVYRNLAVSHESQGEYSKADSYYRRCLSVLDAAVPPQHAKTAQYADDFADLLRKTGKTEDADAFAAVARRQRELAAAAGTP